MKAAWIGFIHVQPVEGASPFGEGRKGAFTHALALAADAEDFRRRVAVTLEEHDLLAIEMSDIAPVSDYASEDRISAEMEELLLGLSPQAPAKFDVFDTYRQPDA